MPYALIPTLHCYYPDLNAIGHDYSDPRQSVDSMARSLQPSDVVLCEERMCDTLAPTHTVGAEEKVQLHPVGPQGRRLYVLRLRPVAERNGRAG